MKKRSKQGIFIFLLLSVPFLTYGQHDSKDLPVYLDTQYTFRERAADLVARMTLAEKVKQLHTNHAPAIPRLGVHQYFYWNEAQHGINRFYASFYDGDGKNARGKVRPKATSFPTNFAASMTWDPALIYTETSAISDEARGFLDKSLFGKGQNNLGDSRDNYGNLTFWAPTINMDRDPRWGRTDEAFGEDPFLTSVMAAAWVNGFQGATIAGRPKSKYLKAAATAKHYALNNVENNRKGVSSNVDNQVIRDYYTKPYAYLIKHARLSGVMTSYNAINETPAVANTFMVNLLLKRTYGFNGYTTSDCNAIGTTYHTFPRGHFWAPPGWKAIRIRHKTFWVNEKTKDTISGEAGGQALAVRAGTSLNCTGGEYTLANIKEAIKAGILNSGVIDRALTSVFTVRMQTGEFDPPSQVPYTSISKEVIQSSAHRRLAEEVAENALVLLKNKPLPGKTAKLLPLQSDTLRDIVIIGNLAGKLSLGGYSGDPSVRINAVKGITEVLTELNPHIRVKFDSTNSSLTSPEPVVLSETVKSDIRQADVVIVFIGTNETVSREGLDRASLAIPGNYNSLIHQVAEQGNKNMILVIQSEGPLDINLVEQYFPAIVFSGYNGQSQGTALANVLAGKKNPSGHLSFTWYRNDAQLPDKSNYHLKPGKTSGLGRTYMYFTKKPLYPFGYGLSYTEFTFSNFRLSGNSLSPDDSVIVSFDVTNTGTIAGAGVAQLYVDFPEVKGLQLPINKLEGFQKTKILAPGETQHIAITVKVTQLKRWNEDAMRYVVYNGTYEFQLGKSASDIVAAKNVNVRGQITPAITLVTIAPENLVFYVGEQLDLRSVNKWIKSDVNTNVSKAHLEADHIVEAVNNDGTFLDPSDVTYVYNSNNEAVATVSANGIVRFVGKGVVTIAATVDGVSGSAVFVVR